MSTLHLLGFCPGLVTQLSFVIWLPFGAGCEEDRPVGQVQSRKRWQAFFQRQAVHHWSRCSMPYTFRHFLASPRAFLSQKSQEGTDTPSWLRPGAQLEEQKPLPTQVRPRATSPTAGNKPRTSETPSVGLQQAGWGWMPGGWPREPTGSLTWHCSGPGVEK